MRPPHQTASAFLRELGHLQRIYNRVMSSEEFFTEDERRLVGTRVREAIDGIGAACERRVGPPGSNGKNGHAKKSKPNGTKEARRT